MFVELWNSFLFQPLFNGLIWIYNNWTDQNLGWAIVYLTISLRVLLLPLTMITEYNKHKNQEVSDELARLDRELANDPVLKKEEFRRMLKKRKVQPWAKLLSLGIQGLVLVLLYQVFIGGIEGQRLQKVLYSWVDLPGVINTNFYGFELGMRHGIIWSGIVAVWLFLEIYFHSRKNKLTHSKADLSYVILFPLGVFLILWWLPMVKSVFVLTSLLFSVIIGQFSGVIFRPAKQQLAGGQAVDQAKQDDAKLKKT